MSNGDISLDQTADSNPRCSIGRKGKVGVPAENYDHNLSKVVSSLLVVYEPTPKYMSGAMEYYQLFSRVYAVPC